MIAWLLAFLFTQAVEVPLYLALLRPPPRLRALLPDELLPARPLGRARALTAAFGASALTHPVVWLAFPLVPAPYELQVVLAEAFAVLAEAWWLSRWGAPWPLLWSLAANGASLGLGLAARALWGAP